MKKVKLFAIVLIAFVCFTQNAIAQTATPVSEMKSGWITAASIDATVRRMQYVIVDKNLDRYVDGAQSDPVDRNWVAVFVTTSDDGKGHITGFKAILNANGLNNMQNDIHNGGSMSVTCSFANYNKLPYGYEVDPTSVPPRSLMADIGGNTAPILGYVQ